jgi:hypothetical protein
VIGRDEAFNVYYRGTGLRGLDQLALGRAPLGPSLLAPSGGAGRELARNRKGEAST